MTILVDNLLLRIADIEATNVTGRSRPIEYIRQFIVNISSHLATDVKLAINALSYSLFNLDCHLIAYGAVRQLKNKREIQTKIQNR